MESIQIKTLLGALSLLCASAFAQTPGGVAGVRYLKNAEVETIGKDNGITLFCVQKEVEKEAALWSLKSDSSEEIVMTNFRCANLNKGSYINFAEVPKEPTIAVYSTNKVGKNGRLRAGTVASNLPIKASDSTNEYLVYDRVLSYKERRKVETYLALQNDISLSQVYPTDYLSSNGTIVWSGENSYNSEVAGIGRDDQSGLNKRAANSPRSMLQVTCNDTLANNMFLLYGNNGGAATFVRYKGGFKALGRRWKTQATGSLHAKHFTLKFDQTRINQISPLKKGERYWLLVDSTGLYKSKEPFEPVFDSVVIAGNCELRLLAAPDNLVVPTKWELEDEASNTSVFANVAVSPNPTTDGIVHVRVELSTPQAINVTLFDVSGRRLSIENKSADTYFDFTCRLPQKGVHILVLTCGNEQKSIELISK